MRDDTNLKNIKMFLLYGFTLITCSVIVVVLSILLGMGEPSLVSNHYDRPRASLSFHDHRL